ncbi:hypothetical protein V5N11_029576 [Cardamine amara subsp. amara]|uniref:Uncharacterized protein n=1 Tax=Cardamine amara subsp. amara TaxID=228776 RepID=A0ABD1AU67_CARAN
MVFLVKKMTSVISGVFSRKKTLAGENRGERYASSEEITKAGETLYVGKAKSKQNLLQKKESFWESARVRLKIIILGQRLTTRKRRRRSLNMVKNVYVCLCETNHNVLPLFPIVRSEMDP